MKKNYKDIQNRFISRRQFLVGAGSTFLTLPPLISLMPSSVAAQLTSGKKIRSVICVGSLGINKEHMDPNPIDLIQAPGHSVYYKTLNSFQGPISRMIDTSFQPLYPYMNLIKGLSLTGGRYQGHNSSFLAGAHSQSRGNETFGRTLDVVMEKSNNVYSSSDLVVAKAVRISSEDGMPSYDTSNGVKISSSFVQGDLSLFNLLFGSLSTTTTPSQTNLNNELIVDRVFADLKNLETDKRLSTHDKQLLDRYIAGVFDLQKKVKANNSSGGITCTKPTLTIQAKNNGNRFQFPYNGWGITSTNKLFENYIEMIRLAFLCDLTRVVVINNMVWDDRPISTSSSGGLHHECPDSETSADRHQYGLKQMAKLATALINTPDTLNGGGNILDNSSIMFTNELGDWTTGHRILNMPCVMFGKAGGYLKTGYFVDYTNKVDGFKSNVGESGRPYKQMLQTILQSMGVPKSEYILYGDGNGYGEFVQGINQNGRVAPNAYFSYKNEHNDPLPFIT